MTDIAGSGWWYSVLANSVVVAVIKLGDAAPFNTWQYIITMRGQTASAAMVQSRIKCYVLRF